MYRKIAVVAMLVTVLVFGAAACGNVENGDNISGRMSTAIQGSKGEKKLEYRDTNPLLSLLGGLMAVCRRLSMSRIRRVMLIRL